MSDASTEMLPDCYESEILGWHWPGAALSWQGQVATMGNKDKVVSKVSTYRYIW